MGQRSSVYIIVKGTVTVPQKVYSIFQQDYSIIENNQNGILVHFQDTSWSPHDEEVQIVEDFLARISKSDFLFIRVSSYDDIEVAGGWLNNPFNRFLPANLVEFLQH